MIFERDYMIYKNYFLCLILIYCIGIGLRLYWANNKENMHQDEVATFSISECDGAYYSPDVKVPPKVTATGKDIKRFFFIHDNRIKGTLHDLRYMWHNVYDYNHKFLLLTDSNFLHRFKYDRCKIHKHTWHIAQLIFLHVEFYCITAYITTLL